MRIGRYYGYLPGPVALATAPSMGSMPGSLLIAPGYYNQLPDGVFDFTRPGLYKSWVPIDVPGGNAGNTYNRIVAGGDAYALASAAAWLTSFGTADAGTSLAVRTAKAMNSKLHLQCGDTAEWLKSLADAAGIPCRLVHVLTAEDSNGFNDGHEAVEMKVGGAWRLFDASLKVVYRNFYADPAGPLLNLIEVIAALQGGTATVEKLAPFNWASEPVVVSKFDPATWIESEQIYTDTGMLAGVRRLFQIPFVEVPGQPITGYLPAGTEGRAAWVASLGYKVIPQADFMAQFYSAGA